MSLAPASRREPGGGGAPGAAGPTPVESLLVPLALFPAAAMALPSTLWSAWPAWLGPAAFGDPLPLASAAGRTLLAALPLLLVLIWTQLRAALRGGPFPGAIQRGPIAILLLLLLARAEPLLGRPIDHDGAAALLPPALALLGALAGLCLGSGSARILVRGLCALSLSASAAALATAPFDGPLGLAGVLGNSGPSTQLALPGALAGLWLWSRGQGGERPLGALAFAAAALHASLAPALAALAALALGALALLASGPASNARRLARWGLGAAGLSLAGGLAFLASGLGGPAADPRPGPLSGVEVRLWLWSTVPSLLQRDWGQPKPAFEDAYETLRPPAERALSAAASGGPTAAEHLHQDWFQLAFDLGPFAAGLGLVLALAAATAALSALRGGTPTKAALGAALLGLLLLSLQHTPLTRNAPAAWLAGLAAGALAPRSTQRGDRAQAAAASLTVLGLLAGPVSLGPPALGLCLQGQRLAAALVGPSLPQAAEDLLPPPGWQRYSAPLALGLAARAEGDPLRRALWTELWLEKRPHTPEALIQAGLAEVDDDLERAADLWERALAIDPSRSEARFNLARLYLTAAGRLDASQRLERLSALAPELPREPLENLLLEGQRQGWLCPVAVARTLVALGEPAGADPSLSAGAFDLGPLNPFIPPGLAEAIDARAALAPEDSDARATLESLAHHLWARQSANEQRFDDALRSYRQALRQSRFAGRPGSWLIRAELAAAARQLGREQEALETEPPAQSVEAALLPLFARPR